MKKYAKSELYALLKKCYYCDVRTICTELYDAIDTTGLVPVKTTDDKVMTNLRKKINTLENPPMGVGLSKQYASICIINNNNPVFVTHNKKPNLNEGLYSIKEIQFIFKDYTLEGEETGNIFYKVYDVRGILDTLGYEDELHRDGPITIPHSGGPKVSANTLGYRKITDMIYR